MLLFDDFLDRVVKIVTDRFPSFDPPRDVSFDNTGRADLAIRTFRLSSKLGIDPRSVFASLEPALKSQKFVEKVVLEGAYINITLDPWSMLSTITESIERSGRFPDVFQESEKVSVEHTSTNPTGPLHIGRARNSIIGDTLQRVLKRYGYRVTTQYFVNDSGKQVMALYLGYTKYGSGEKTLQEILRCYQAIYRDMEKDPQVEREVEALIRRYEEGDRELIEGIKSTAKVALDDISSSMRAIGIEIDDYTWESDFITGGDVKRIIENNREKLQSDDDGGRCSSRSLGGEEDVPHEEGRDITVPTQGCGIPHVQGRPVRLVRGGRGGGGPQGPRQGTGVHTARDNRPEAEDIVCFQRLRIARDREDVNKAWQHCYTAAAHGEDGRGGLQYREGKEA
ncbi:arginine--tRNA ligase [Thermogymnomonas acidicola]|uniref:arginine--tRNA ligase domain-containing protein n=1 Tax=Thermogymnomonas acidicola TaxID=399579 RepID=UPI00139695E8|nr:arginine--tRNA ligase [Thermogymnomonas acidicola]